jgi:hypothetical protein
MGHPLEGLRLRLLVAAAVSVALAGCTLVGAGVGSLIDKGNRKGRPPDTLAGWRIAEVGRGADVTLSLDDGRQVAGRFEGLERRRSRPTARGTTRRRARSLDWVRGPRCASRTATRRRASWWASTWGRSG